MSDYQKFVLYDVSWSAYEAILNALGERPGLRATYDRGTLELMTRSQRHEFCKRLLRSRVEFLCFELDISMRAGGSFTFRKKTVECGLEPDESYWIQNYPATRGKIELDFDRDPPPDLAIEIEVSRSSLDRHGIYAALGVPELWAFDGKELRVYHLSDEGTYHRAESSLAFPFLPMAELPRFLRLDDERDEQTRLREFVQWAREQHERAGD